MTGFVILFLAGLLGVGAKIPEGYVMQITPHCGTNGIADGYVDILTDLDAKAFAVCRGGVKVDFTTIDNVNFRMPFSYAAGGSNPCVFVKRNKAKVYAAKIVFSYGEPGNLVHQHTEEYTVTCTFSPKGVDDSPDQVITDTLIAAKEIQTNVGRNSSSVIQLNMVNVRHEDLSPVHVHLGRTVLLKASFTGAEAGIRPVSCDAIDSTNARYAILRAGCGDGLVFEQDQGFETTAKETISPYFKAFSVNADVVMKFECNFTLCENACDGSSCEVQSTSPPPNQRLRQRRDVPEPILVSAVSRAYDLKPSPQDAEKSK